MNIVADASALLSVILNEEDRALVIEKTAGKSPIAPEVLPYEIGNALIAARRKGRLNNKEALEAFLISQQIEVRLLPVRIYDAMKVAISFGIYSYDAYYLQCCLENRSSLISFDVRMCEVARKLGIEVV